MLGWFNALAIQKKLIAIIMLTVTGALVLACGAFSAYELFSYRTTLKREMATLAGVLGASSQAALAFDDPRAARETLGSLVAEQRVVEACLYRPDGRVLGEYRGTGWLGCPDEPTGESEEFLDGRFRLTRDVRLNGEVLGRLFLVCDLSEMNARLARYALIALGVLGASLLVALILSTGLQRSVSRPILKLAETAKQVSCAGDYGIRAPKFFPDELGELVDRFNEMLDQIHTRDIALKQAQDELEARVVERTAALQMEVWQHELTQRDLLAAKLVAEESNRAKSAFLAKMSHELRTPLNAIIGYSEMLEEEAAEEGRPEIIPDVRKICGAGRHLLALINDVLDLSKIEAGKAQLRIEDCDVAAMLDEVASTVSAAVRKNNNRLTVQAEGGLSTIRTDATKLRQVLLNLIGNAAKFTENGEIAVRVRCIQEERGDWFEWIVRDTGIGIAPEHLAKLFQPFVQATTEVSQKYGGTGLGLAISQRLCVIMGGKISVASELGKGSVFTVRLPARMEPVDARPAVSAELRLPAGARRVLLIDDDPATQELVGRALAREGIQTIEARTGLDGLERAARENPDAVLLDIKLPGLNGWTVLTRLKADPATAHIPVIVYSVTEDPERAERLGAAACVVKTAGAAGLAALVSREPVVEPAAVGG